uniref:Serine/threonine-protein phosphatase 2A activator n=1 Tax=Oryctolagus cuniculus TaxID=9986 RepID=G1TX59_RABIT
RKALLGYLLILCSITLGRRPNSVLQGGPPGGLEAGPLGGGANSEPGAGPRQEGRGQQRTRVGPLRGRATAGGEASGAQLAVVRHRGALGLRQRADRRSLLSGKLGARGRAGDLKSGCGVNAERGLRAPRRLRGRWLRASGSRRQAVEKLLALLDTLDRWIDETPPVDQPSRFGNKAYRTWYAKLDEEAEGLVAAVVPAHLAAAVPEVAVYLKESVGNSTRIDYGTGHEAAFAAFLCCLCKIGVLRVDDQIAIVFKVFNRYLEVMRKLQKTYRMEPAGSQGVWGLDDFQFLPFIWGSSQLIDHPFLEPRHFVDEKAVNENHKDYMFLECILFITEMKTGPFAEHSNQLWNISAVPSWSKVNQGLIRMYKAEVSAPVAAAPPRHGSRGPRPARVTLGLRDACVGTGWPGDPGAHSGGGEACCGQGWVAEGVASLVTGPETPACSLCLVCPRRTALRWPGSSLVLG